VVPLLYRGLAHAGKESIPQAVWSGLVRDISINTKRNFRLAHHAANLLRAYEEKNIRVIPFKGIFLANAVYRNMSLRQIDDIDLLVSQEDMERSRMLLSSLEFNLSGKFDQEEVYTHRQNQVEVDLHWRLGPDYFPVNFEFDLLWQRCNRMELGDVVIRTLSPEDLLLILCVQVAKDSWERRQLLEHLAKVCDIAEIIHTDSTLDWQLIASRAAELGISRVVNLSLYLCQKLLHVEELAALNPKLTPDRTTRSLARQLCADLAALRDRNASNRNSPFDLRLRIRQLRFYLSLRERPADKWAHIARVLRALTTKEGMDLP
jgi:hypothetical protein